MNNTSLLQSIAIVIGLASPMTYAKNLEFTQNVQGEKFTCAHNNLTKAYDELGYRVRFTTYPSKRSLMTANLGKADGEMLRVKGIEKDYPNLTIVPVPICAVQLVLIANNNVKLKRDYDINKYHLGITSGYVHQEKFAQKYNINVTRVHRNELLVDLLMLKRVDAIFLTKEEALAIIADNSDYQIIERFNEHVYLYHYLHKNHLELVPTITQTLRDLSDKGELDLFSTELDRKPKFGYE